MGDDDSNASQEAVPASKPWWMSRTIIGLLVIGIGQIVKHFGGSIDAAALGDAIGDLMALIGSALALWGRVKATQPIHFRTRKTVPGGPYNPDAEVRRAEPVHRPSFPPRGGLKKGSAEVTMCVAVGVLWVLFALGMMAAKWILR